MNETKYLLDKFADIFADRLVSVVLFGSYARQNYSENSDIDVMVVLENYEEPNLSGLRKEFLVKFKKKADLHFFSRDEAIQNFHDFSPLFVSLLLGRKILFDKGMFFKDLSDNLARRILVQNIKYCEGEKIWEMKKVAQNLAILH